ncbi:MAG: 5-carboxymethyl-2-hydroxymuconate isomerase [Rhodocyclales bacterium GWA2_65_20]|nr:MAG: 5-carboxymethyl-2-hydroxymuconate isomerase [Rhodocyclales bacterium GWA2_65_20]
MPPVFSLVSPLVPVAGSDSAFPVRRIYCVARNYAEHAREMGGSGREAPFFFMKPADAVLPVPLGATGQMAYPPRTADLHHEIELVAAIGLGGRNIAAAAAHRHIYGYAVGLDMTRRDLQAELKKQGRPWDLAKGFDQSAPLGAIHPATEIGHPQRGAIQLEVNGVARQRGDLADMIWSVPEIVAILSEYFELQAGDLVFTGTPAGVGPVLRGDRLVGSIAGLGELSLTIVCGAVAELGCGAVAESG